MQTEGHDDENRRFWRRLKSLRRVTVTTKTSELAQRNNNNNNKICINHIRVLRCRMQATSDIPYALHTFERSKCCFVTNDHYMVSCSFTSINTIRTFRWVPSMSPEDGSLPLCTIRYTHKPKQTAGKLSRYSTCYTIEEYGSIPITAKEMDFSPLNAHTGSGPNQPLHECVTGWLSPRRSNGREMTSKAHFNIPPRLKKQV